jgi:hypothetical protein
MPRTELHHAELSDAELCERLEYGVGFSGLYQALSRLRAGRVDKAQDREVKRVT